MKNLWIKYPNCEMREDGFSLYHSQPDTFLLRHPNGNITKHRTDKEAKAEADRYEIIIVRPY